MLPFKLSGRVAVDGIPSAERTVEAMLAALSTRLEREKPSSVTRHGDRLEFTAGLFRPVSSWNPLIAVSRGTITVEPGAEGLSIRYELWFTQLIVVVALAVGLLFGPAIFSADDMTFVGRVAVLAAAWLWLAGGNIALTAYRFPRLLRQAAKGAEDRPGALP